METTYAHLSDLDYADDAKEAWGIKEPDEISPLTPALCDTCQEPLADDWVICPKCGHEYGPNTHQLKEQIKQQQTEDALDVETDEEKEHFKRVQKMLNDPEELAAYLNQSE